MSSARKRTGASARRASGPAPARSSDLIGREREIEEIERIFGRGARLLTLVGLPGVGKSRLARELALRVTDPVIALDLRDVSVVPAALEQLADAASKSE